MNKRAMSPIQGKDHDMSSESGSGDCCYGVYDLKCHENNYICD